MLVYRGLLHQQHRVDNAEGWKPKTRTTQDEKTEPKNTVICFWGQTTRGQGLPCSRPNNQCWGNRSRSAGRQNRSRICEAVIRVQIHVARFRVGYRREVGRGDSQPTGNGSGDQNTDGIMGASGSQPEWEGQRRHFNIYEHKSIHHMIILLWLIQAKYLTMTVKLQLFFHFLHVLIWVVEMKLLLTSWFLLKVTSERG